MKPLPAFLTVMMVLTICFMFVRTIKADSTKIGDGPFVMAVSYTESYDDLQYVANFKDCDQAMDYYNKNCINAKIMMCQLEDYLYMPINHNTNNSFSSFDFEIDTKQSCGFVKTQEGYSTFVGEDN